MNESNVVQERPNGASRQGLRWIILFGAANAIVTRFAVTSIPIDFWGAVLTTIGFSDPGMVELLYILPFIIITVYVIALIIVSMVSKRWLFPESRLWKIFLIFFGMQVLAIFGDLVFLEVILPKVSAAFDRAIIWVGGTF